MVMCSALLQPYTILPMRYKVDRKRGGGRETQGAGSTVTDARGESHNGPKGNNIIVIILLYHVILEKSVR